MKIILFLIGLFFISLAIIIKFFPGFFIRILKKLFTKMYGYDQKPTKQKDVEIKKKENNYEQDYSDYEVIDDNQKTNSNGNSDQTKKT